MICDIEPDKTCDACFKTLPIHNGKVTEPHHIKSRGAGGGNNKGNLLQLCFRCHYQIYHQKGWLFFCVKFSHLERKVKKALKK